MNDIRKLTTQDLGLFGNAVRFVRLAAVRRLPKADITYEGNNPFNSFSGSQGVITMDSQPGVRAYNSFSLSLYDWWVLSVANRFAWRCPTSDIQLPFYRKNLSNRHLDIGAGTGYYPRHCMNICQLTLLDLNTECLFLALRRIGPARVKATVRHDIFQPFPEYLHQRYNSLALYYVLHCLNGSAEDKFIALKNASQALSADGMLFGTTISGELQRHNIFGRILLKIMNRKGIFTNYHDSAALLQSQLRQLFREVTVNEVGAVIMFTARYPLHSEAESANIPLNCRSDADLNDTPGETGEQSLLS
ncbi:hypothetical protein A7K99_07685 [Tatumella citrea]|uniref:Methyltransferase type 12 domain-containing protein n=2 Tax=Tatumella citrea TaxID=53336 RepID=A0A1Y0L7M8_TATCI|nr:hypothetical protein A7K98_07685 [Tatumella citrea]ARU97706.1 hypothetical protein A7K99_07685 [Tatumella citrea]